MGTLIARALSAAELNRGVGMRFYPIAGIAIESLSYDEESRRYTRRMGAFGGHNLLMYGEGVVEVEIFFECIGDGEGVEAGVAYPDHWVFDPNTGARLAKTNHGHGGGWLFD